MRVRWDEPGFEGFLALGLDALVARGEVTRPVDQRRSNALKGKVGRKPGQTVRPRTVVAPGAVFTPARQKSNPLYGLPEWEKGQ